MSDARTIAVVVGGGLIPPTNRHFDAVIVADSGLDVALDAGLEPTLLVGDLDSVSPEGLLWATEHELPIQRYPTDKDDTDTALAVRCAVSMGAASDHGELVLLGAVGSSRLDHLLGTFACLGHPSLAGANRVTAYVGTTRVEVVHPGHRITLELTERRVFSVLALHGGCAGVSVTGARWPLADASLPAGSTLGISNESLGDPITVSVGSGVLTVIVPGDAS
jgi:thiamine pyrophosphokinase